MSFVAEISEIVDGLADDLITFASELVRIPSVADHETPAQERVAAELSALGMETEIFACAHDEVAGHPAFSDDGFSPTDRVNVVGTLPGADPAEGRSLILNGHVDVVPVGDADQWHRDPFSGDIAEGRLWGRGACDMKAGLAAGIYALRALRTLGFAPPGDIYVHSVIGEESGGLGSLTNVVQGRTADGVIILEPTALRAIPVHAGALSFRLTVAGVSAHAANRKHGVSALEKFELLHGELRQLEQTRHEREPHPLFEDPTAIAPLSIGTVRAGDWPSSVPDELVAEGRIGVFPGETPEQVRTDLEEALASASARDAFLTHNPPTLEWIEGQFEPGETPADHPLVSSVRDAHSAVTGEQAALGGLTAGTDLRLYTIHGNTPGLLYGPGHIDQAHTANEYVDIDEVVTATKVVALAVADWTASRP